MHPTCEFFKTLTVTVSVIWLQVIAVSVLDSGKRILCTDFDERNAAAGFRVGCWKHLLVASGYSVNLPYSSIRERK